MNRCEKTLETGAPCGAQAVASVHPEDEYDVALVAPSGRGYWLACSRHAAQERERLVLTGTPRNRHAIRLLGPNGEVRS